MAGCYPVADPIGAAAAIADEVHVWRMAVDHETAMSRWSLLDDVERARADRFSFDHLRRRFVARRGWLRELVGAYSGRPPGDVAFRYGPIGKPSADGPWFNLSDTGDLVLVAISARRELGVDVEAIRTQSDLDALARRFFAPGEISALAALDPAPRVGRFFDYWTLKEAFLKAEGVGLSHPLDAFECELEPDGPGARLHLLDRPDAPVRWQMLRLPIDAGHRAALAVEAGVTAVRLLDER